MLTTHNLSDRGQNVALTGEESTLPAATRWRWIRIWMICATPAGDGWLWCAIGLTAFAVTVSAGVAMGTALAQRAVKLLKVVA